MKSGGRHTGLDVEMKPETNEPMVIPEAEGRDVVPASSEAAAPAPDVAETVFEVRELSVAYGDVPAVADVSLDIRGNQITALIGPSGCGKTTVLRCLNRM